MSNSKETSQLWTGYCLWNVNRLYVNASSWRLRHLHAFSSLLAVLSSDVLLHDLQVRNLLGVHSHTQTHTVFSTRVWLKGETRHQDCGPGHGRADAFPVTAPLSHIYFFPLQSPHSLETRVRQLHDRRNSRTAVRRNHVRVQHRGGQHEEETTRSLFCPQPEPNPMHHHLISTVLFTILVDSFFRLLLVESCPFWLFCFSFSAVIVDCAG